MTWEGSRNRPKKPQQRAKSSSMTRSNYFKKECNPTQYTQQKLPHRPEGRIYAIWEPNKHNDPEQQGNKPAVEPAS